MAKRKKKLIDGDVVVFDPSAFNVDFWNSLTEREKKKFYGRFGYGAKKLKTFVYLQDVFLPDVYKGKRMFSGHCLLVDLDTKQIVFAHPDEFRKATESEF